MTRLSPSKRVAGQIVRIRLSPWFLSSIAVSYNCPKGPPEADFGHFGPLALPDCRQSDGSPPPVYRRDFRHLSTDFQGLSSIAVTFPVYRRGFDSSIAVQKTRLSPGRSIKNLITINDLRLIFRALTRARVNAFLLTSLTPPPLGGKPPPAQPQGRKRPSRPASPNSSVPTARPLQARLCRAMDRKRMHIGRKRP